MLNARGVGRRSVVAALLVSAALVAGCGGQELEPLPEQPPTETTPTEEPQEFGQQEEEEAPEGENLDGNTPQPETPMEYNAEGHAVFPDRGPTTDEVNVEAAAQTVSDFFNAYLDAMYTKDTSSMWDHADQGCVWCGSRIITIDEMKRESLTSEGPRSASLNFVGGSGPTETESEHVVIFEVPEVSYRIVDEGGNIVQQLTSPENHFVAKVRPVGSGWVVVEGDTFSPEAVAEILQYWENEK